MSIPSYIVKESDIIELKDNIVGLSWYEEIKKINESYQAPTWLTKDGITRATVVRRPDRTDMDPSINEQYIVEFYSK